MQTQQLYLEWCSAPAVDAQTKAELAAISPDPREIEERFYRELEFGTAGLRGILGAGTNRMNRYVVRRATQGLADYLLAVPDAKERGVCIAYDSRHYSQEFAKETAMVLAANGIAVYLFESLRSVPQLSFTMQQLHCMAGVVITASHNPKQYNGYKVYGAYGGQCAPDQAAAIYNCMQRVEMFGAKLIDFDAAVACGAIHMIGAQEDEFYYMATQRLLLCPDFMKLHGGALKLVYTPLHGTGNRPVQTLLSRVGMANVTVVPEQQMPDGDFPTVTAPNPEDPAAFELAIALAEEKGATVCLATDPDADRLGIAVKTGEGAWMTLTGNQIGCILLEHILSELVAQNRLPENGVVIKSIVSTRLADAIAQRYGVALIDVMTGFRFIGEKVDEYAKTGEKTFLFGFEESYGFLAGGLARDKDAICAAMLAAETCVICQNKGITLYDMLRDIYAHYGFYKEKVKSYTSEGKRGMELISVCMEGLRTASPTCVACVPVLAVEDYRMGRCVDSEGNVSAIKQPPSNMLRFLLKNGAWIVIRPSGTEPKLKLYIGANEMTEDAVDATLNRLFSDMDGRIQKLLQ
ncbi:MAG: phospho-sugar mutase [Clostridia bacterium]